MNFYNRTRQAAFTLVELVVVIVILGILASFAIPKFLDLAATARGAVIDGTAGAVRAAANMAYAQAVAEGKSVSAASGQTVSINGSTINLVYGYPADDSIANMITLDGDVAESGTTDGTFEFSGYKADCKVVYAEPTAANGVPTITPTTTCTTAD